MATNRPVDRTGTARPRVVVSVTATADGRVSLNRAERLLDEGSSTRWTAAWPPDVSDLLAQRAAAIEQRHHPTVVLEGSGTFVADDDGPLDLPHTATASGKLWTDFLPDHSAKWFAGSGSRFVARAGCRASTTSRTPTLSRPPG